MSRKFYEAIKFQYMISNYNKKCSISIDVIHIEFKKAYASISEKNWFDQIFFFLNKIKNFCGDPTDERMVAGWTAALCEHAYYVAAHRKEISVRKNFDRQIKKIINLTFLPKFLTYPGPVICGKRQPSFVESIVPTIERFQVMERLPEVFCEVVDSIIVGGSMSYIPFFGIRENKKNKDFSDIDTLIVINKNFFKKSSWNKFMRDDLFPTAEKKKFLNRIKIFQKLLHNNSAEVFSQRFSICGQSFTVSNHFVTPSVFRRMVYFDLKKSLQTKKDEHYIMRDFRTNIFTHPCHARHTFNGERLESVIDGYKIVPEGFISYMPGYIVSNGKFYPGVYQTVISPGFLVFYDRTGETKKLVNFFKKILYRETKSAQKKFPFASYARAHNRYDIFPPGRFEAGHNSYISAKEIKKFLLPPSFNIFIFESAASSRKIISKKKWQEKKNDFVRYKTKKLLEKWKSNEFKKAESEIKNFINKDNFKAIMSLAKKQDHHWYTVTIIQHSKKITVKLPYSYKQTNSRDSVIHEEVFVQTITPSDIMRLNAYEKLSIITNKVYIASIMDPADEYKKTPISYALIIPVIDYY
jgi:hypothetical protein